MTPDPLTVTDLRPEVLDLALQIEAGMRQDATGSNYHSVTKNFLVVLLQRRMAKLITALYESGGSTREAVCDLATTLTELADHQGALERTFPVRFVSAPDVSERREAFELLGAAFRRMGQRPPSCTSASHKRGRTKAELAREPYDGGHAPSRHYWTTLGEISGLVPLVPSRRHPLRAFEQDSVMAWCQAHWWMAHVRQIDRRIAETPKKKHAQLQRDRATAMRYVRTSLSDARRFRDDAPPRLP